VPGAKDRKRPLSEARKKKNTDIVHTRRLVSFSSEKGGILTESLEEPGYRRNAQAGGVKEIRGSSKVGNGGWGPWPAKETRKG